MSYRRQNLSHLTSTHRPHFFSPTASLATTPCPPFNVPHSAPAPSTHRPPDPSSTCYHLRSIVVSISLRPSFFLPTFVLSPSSTGHPQTNLSHLFNKFGVIKEDWSRFPHYSQSTVDVYFGDFLSLTFPLNFLISSDQFFFSFDYDLIGKTEGKLSSFLPVYRVYCLLLE